MFRDVPQHWIQHSIGSNLPRIKIPAYIRSHKSYFQKSFFPCVKMPYAVLTLVSHKVKKKSIYQMCEILTFGNFEPFEVQL